MNWQVNLGIGEGFEAVVEWLNFNLEPFFLSLKFIIESTISGLEWLLLIPPALVFIPVICFLAFRLEGKFFGVFGLVGLLLIYTMGLWAATMQTLALVLTSALFALLIGIPLGIWSSRSDRVEKVVRPILDFMQTMPAYVYLIPAIMFFQLGNVPGAVATVIFAMPPAVRLTSLGIRQLPHEVIEASQSFGSTPTQELFKVQLPMAMPSILAGVNQTIMLSLSMTVIASMIGAEGLGKEVYNGITRMEIGDGFEAGLAVVIIAMLLDRMTQALGNGKKKRS